MGESASDGEGSIDMVLGLEGEVAAGGDADVVFCAEAESVNTLIAAKTRKNIFIFGDIRTIRCKRTDFRVARKCNVQVC